MTSSLSRQAGFVKGFFFGLRASPPAQAGWAAPGHRGQPAASPSQRIIWRASYSMSDSYTRPGFWPSREVGGASAAASGPFFGRRPTLLHA